MSQLFPKMKPLFFALMLLMAFNMKSQYLIPVTPLGPWVPINIPRFPYDQEWRTGVFTSVNIGAMALNTIHFKSRRRKSNAGFLLFPGLAQMAMGGLYKRNHPSGKIDVAIGCASVLFTAARMIYRPGTARVRATARAGARARDGATARVQVNPWYIPSSKSSAADPIAIGLSFRIQL